MINIYIVEYKCTRLFKVVNSYKEAMKFIQDEAKKDNYGLYRFWSQTGLRYFDTGPNIYCIEEKDCEPIDTTKYKQRYEKPEIDIMNNKKLLEEISKLKQENQKLKMQLYKLEGDNLFK